MSEWIAPQRVGEINPQQVLWRARQNDADAYADVGFQRKKRGQAAVRGVSRIEESNDSGGGELRDFVAEVEALLEVHDDRPASLERMRPVAAQSGQAVGE